MADQQEPEGHETKAENVAIVWEGSG